MGARTTSRPLDLNLVRVFAAVYETRSVTLAAERLFMTQPSVSYGLARLREALSDPLFVRTAEGMTPTVLAQAAYGEFRQGLGHLEEGLAATRSFEPASSQRRFRTSMSDLAAMTFVPPLMAELAAMAPQVELEVAELDVALIPSQLAAGQIDAAIGNFPTIGEQTTNVSLFHQNYACLVRAGHPLAAGRARSLSMKQYMAARHVYVSSRSSGHHLLEGRLLALGERRKIALQMQHFTALMSVVQATDLVATLPSMVARLFAAQHGMRLFPLPFACPSIDMRLHWNGAREKNVALQWLLGTVREVARHLDRD